jgi:hypothetical protein
MLQEVSSSKGIAAAVAFSGQLISVTPEYAEYDAGDEVRIHIKSHIEADGLHWYSFWWYSYFRFYDADTGELLADNYNIHGHGTAPLNPHDEVDEDFYQSIGRMPGKNLTVHVELYGFEGGSAPFVLCDIKNCLVPLKGVPPPPPPPPPEEFPWKWVAIGSGVLVLIAVLLKRRE